MTLQDDFNTIVAGIGDVTGDKAKLPRDETVRIVRQVLGQYGKLEGDNVRWLVEHTGWSRATLYDIAGTIRAQVPEIDGPADTTFFDKMVETGNSLAFEFDSTALGLMTAFGGNQARFTTEVDKYFAKLGLDVRMPSAPTVSRLWRDTVDKAVREGTRHGYKNRSSTSLQIRWEPEVVNQYVEMDEFILDIAALCLQSELEAEAREDADVTSDFCDEHGVPLDPIKLDSKWWVVRRPRLVTLLEAKSRYVRSWALLARPVRATDTTACIVDAVDIRKIPGRTAAFVGGAFTNLVTDNAMCFRAEIVSAVMEMTGGGLTIVPGFSPNDKAKVERVGRTLQAKIVLGRVGFLSETQYRDGRDMLHVPVERLLKFDQILTATHEAVETYNNVDVHSTLRRTPLEAHLAGCQVPQRVDDAILAGWMLDMPYADGKRHVHPDGVHAFNGGYYLANDLADPKVFDHDVQIRRFHHRQDKIAVFSRSKRRVEDRQDRFVSFAYDYRQLPKAERKRILRNRAVGARAITENAKTARETMARAAQTNTGNLVEAAVAGSAEPTEPPATALDARAERTGQVVGTGRRPKTRRGRNDGDKKLAATAGSKATAELNALEASLNASLEDDTTANENQEPEDR